MFIELNEFKIKYNISDMSNEKLVRMSIEKEFPEFEEFHPEWTIEDNFIKVEFYEKEVWLKIKEQNEYEEKCRIKLLELFYEHVPENERKAMAKQFNVPLDKLAEDSVEKCKKVCGSYSEGLRKLKDPNYIIDSFKKHKHLIERLIHGESS